jgi:hypothetical protein
MAERKKFLLRLPPKLHEELRAWAEDEMRSLNGQLEYLLRQAVSRRNRATGQKLEDEAAGEDTP